MGSKPTKFRPATYPSDKLSNSIKQKQEETPKTKEDKLPNLTKNTRSSSGEGNDVVKNNNNENQNGDKYQIKSDTGQERWANSRPPVSPAFSSPAKVNLTSSVEDVDISNISTTINTVNLSLNRTENNFRALSKRTVLLKSESEDEPLPRRKSRKKSVIDSTMEDVVIVKMPKRFYSLKRNNTSRAPTVADRDISVLDDVLSDCRTRSISVDDRISCSSNGEEEEEEEEVEEQMDKKSKHNNNDKYNGKSGKRVKSANSNFNKTNISPTTTASKVVENKEDGENMRRFISRTKINKIRLMGVQSSFDFIEKWLREIEIPAQGKV